MSAPRRRFLQSLAVAPWLPAGLARAQAPREASGSAALAGHLADVVRARWGGQLDEAGLAEVARLIAEGLDGAEKLRAVKLGNADEPATTFFARPAGALPPRPVAAPSSTPPVPRRRSGGRS